MWYLLDMIIMFKCHKSRIFRGSSNSTLCAHQDPVVRTAPKPAIFSHRRGARPGPWWLLAVSSKQTWLVVSNIFYFSIYCHPNWRTHIFHRGRAQPPTRNHEEQKKQVGFPFENEEFQVSWSFPIFAPMFGAKRSTRTTSGFAGSDFVPPIWFI